LYNHSKAKVLYHITFCPPLYSEILKEPSALHMVTNWLFPKKKASYRVLQNNTNIIIYLPLHKLIIYTQVQSLFASPWVIIISDFDALGHFSTKQLALISASNYF
jgi:hypothetical protein